MGKLFIGFFSVFCISNSYNYSNIVSYQSLSSNEQQAMMWVKENSKYDDKFLVLGSQLNPAHSSLTEWFPALADRRSVTTVQGQEWLGNYHNAIDIYALYQQCLSEDLDCIREIDKKTGIKEDCIFISYENSSQKPEKNILYLSLLQSSQFNQVFSSSTVKIFCLKE